MKVIVLTGIVSVEKANLSRDLAQRFVSKKRVTVIDNIARMPIEDIASKVSLKRVEGDVLTKLPALLHTIIADIVIVAISEQTHPEELFLVLDAIQEQESEWEIYSIALIDTRTCDCFPNVREALEMYADVSVMMPYKLDDVLNYVNPN